CKDFAHLFEDCSENKVTLEVKTLANENGWQSCPGCHLIVELSQGCYHMTCRCSVQFSSGQYLFHFISVTFAECVIINVIIDAKRRVFNEFGVRDAHVRSTLYAERVHRRIEALRFNHVRSGTGTCEE
ncbi:hypothetical protein J3A83DRAFT_4056485, partial [Scleroderma citrinum]